jgi:DNA recombination protein RmuC
LREGVQAKLEANLKQGFENFEKVQMHLKQAELQLLNLNTVGKSINDLNDLLKLPHLRGNFGEAILERLLADLLPVDGYELQYRIVPGSLERVDAVIKYPTCVLPIDSKFPREQVLALFTEADPAALELGRKALYDVMKGLARQIKEKYIRPEHGTTEMALLFVPSETLYFEVLRNLKLCEELQRQKVFMVSPNTLSITLHAIAISRDYYEMAKGVEKTLSDVKKAQQHFDNFERRFDEVGSALGKAQSAFNTASTHLSRYSGAVNRLTGLESEPTVTPALTEPLLS